MASTSRLAVRAAVAAVAVVGLVGAVALVMARDGDDAGRASASATTTSAADTTAADSTGPLDGDAAAARADELFPPAPTPEEARVVSERCQGNLEIEGGVPTADGPMLSTEGHDHGDGGAALTEEDLRYVERTAADGRHERVFGGINPRVEVSTIPFDAQPTDADREAAAAFVDEVAATIEARGWDDPANVARDGYRPMQDCNSHWVNIDAVLDGRDLDPEHPEFVVLEPGLDGKNHFHSVMFMEGTNTGAGPQPFGPLAVWHYHETGSCMLAGVLVVSQTGSACPEGSERYERTPEMLHVRIGPTPFSPDM